MHFDEIILKFMIFIHKNALKSVIGKTLVFVIQISIQNCNSLPF